ncbi:MAG: flagellar assembly protein FliH [Deltaproteobacteria bacterium]|nr:flagellar assembly protein FliH [Deltaproteobacteria bacterium]
MAADQGNGGEWGRIFVDGRMAELGGVERGRSRVWTEKEERDYLEAVRRKAEDKAREILLAAENEARVLRAQARDEGYAAGLEQAKLEQAELRASMGEMTREVLSAIQEQRGKIFQQWRDDLIALLRLAVEQGMGLVLREERRAVLEAFYLQAVRNLESGRSLTVKCNPEDAPAVEDIIGCAKERFPELLQWKVLGDPGVEPGAVVVESESSLAVNTVEGRKAAILKALESLTLP